MKRKILGFSVGLGWMAMSSLAQATPCDSALSSYESAIQGGYDSWAQQIVSNHPECFGASPQTSTTSIHQTSFAQISAISSALVNRFLVSPPLKTASIDLTGAAATTTGKSWSAWGNLTGNAVRNNYMSVSGNAVKSDSDALTTTIGADYALSPAMVVGISAAFDHASGSGYTNGTKNNDLTNKGYAVAPYLGYSLSKQLMLDASLGWGQGELSQSGNVSADADRWFAGANLNYSAWVGNTQLSGRLGYLHGEEKYENAKSSGAAVSGTAAKNKIDQVRLGLQAGWWMNGWMPYIGLTYLSDVSRSTTLAGASDPIGKNAWMWSLGANFLSLSSGITGGIVYNQETHRSHSDDYQLIANIGIRF